MWPLILTSLLSTMLLKGKYNFYTYFYKENSVLMQLQYKLNSNDTCTQTSVTHVLFTSVSSHFTETLFIQRPDLVQAVPFETQPKYFTLRPSCLKRRNQLKYWILLTASHCCSWCTALNWNGQNWAALLLTYHRQTLLCPDICYQSVCRYFIWCPTSSSIYALVRASRAEVNDLDAQ
jgi:hypothetical protein